MKKNILSDNKSVKGTKGFYAALGISAVMIGSACLFAYNEGEKFAEPLLEAENSSSSYEAAVDKKYTDIPKSTTTVYRYTSPPVTTETIISMETVPAAEIVPNIPVEYYEEVITIDETEAEEVYEEEAPEIINVGTNKLENVKPPLSDISNVLVPFSGSELVKNETTGSWQTHNGTDFGAEVGTEVFAVSNGEIMSVTTDPLWGVSVTLDHHNGFVTKYCGLSDQLSVQEGDMVVSGDVIGLVGQTADIESAIAPHLHIEIKHNGSYIDPVSAINS